MFDGATDAAGQARKVESSRDRHYLKMRKSTSRIGQRPVRTIVLH